MNDLTKPCPVCGLTCSGIDRSEFHSGCPGPITPEQTTIIQTVKEYALEHYNDEFGWSEIVECWEDKDICEAVGDCPSVSNALSVMREYVGVREERYREAVGAEIECPDCGTKFGENTVCPNWYKHPGEVDDASLKMERRHDNEY